MRSERPKVLHAIAGRSMLAHVLDTVRAVGTAKLALVVAPGMEAVRAEAARVAPGIEVFEQPAPAGTARRRAGGAAGTAAAQGRRHRRLRRYAAAAARDAAPVAAGAAGRCADRGAGFRGARCHRLRSADPRCGGPRHDDPRACGRQRCRAPRRSVQRRRHGVPRRQPGRAPLPHRQRQCQGRILPDRHRRDRRRDGLDDQAGGRAPRKRRSASTRASSLPRPRRRIRPGPGARRWSRALR